MLTRLDLKKWKVLTTLEEGFISRIKIAFVFHNGESAIFVLESDDVWACNREAKSCWKYNPSNSHEYPKKIIELSNIGVTGFSYGKNGPHIVACTSNGDIYIWGCYTLYSGRNQTNNIPVRIQGGTTIFITDIASRDCDGAFLTSDNKVYLWGNQVNKTQVLCGEPPINDFIQIWKTENYKIVALTCGNEYIVALDDAGAVHVTKPGRNNVQSTKTYYGPSSHCQGTSCTNIIPRIIKKVVCGSDQGMALSTEGQVSLFGLKAVAHTEVGLQRIEGRVVDIAADKYSEIFALKTARNLVYIWGSINGEHIRIPFLVPCSSLHEVFVYFTKAQVTYKPIVFSSHPYLQDTVKDHIAKAFNDQLSSDFIVQVAGKSIYVHKTILGLRSQYFRTMFKECWAEHRQGSISINDFSFPAYKAYLQYLYCDKVNIPPEHLSDLRRIAEVYNEEALISYLKRLEQNMVLDEEDITETILAE